MLSVRSGLTFILVAFAFSSLALAQTPKIGAVSDDFNKSVHFFDWENGTKLGSVSIPQPASDPTRVGDCVITSDGTTAYVTDFNYHIWVIDLTTAPPSLAAGTNPIVVSSPGDDIALTSDDRFLLVAGGSESGTFGSRQGPAVSVDLQTRSQISFVTLPRSPNSIEICDDGTTVLVTAPGTLGWVAKLTLNSNGVLSDTGLSTTIVAAKNATCIAGSQYAAVGSLFDDLYIIDVSDLSIISNHLTAGGSFVSAVASPAGNRLYVRSRGVAAAYAGPSIVEVFEFNPTSGVLTTPPLFDIPVDNDISGQGLDKLALSEGGQLLFVPMNPSVQAGGTSNPTISPIDRVDIFDSSNGSLVDSIQYTGGIYSLTGIAAVGSLAPQIREVVIDIQPGDPLNEINLIKDKEVEVIVFGGNGFDAGQIDPTLVTFAGAFVKIHKNGNFRFWIGDENGDGIVDARARFDTAELQLDTSSTSATLIGISADELFIGSDSVFVTSQRGGRGNGNGNGNGQGPKN